MKNIPGLALHRSERRLARLRFATVLLLAGLPLVSSAARRNDDSEVVTIFSRASDEYVRTKLPDGTLAPEAYAFGDGKSWSATLEDDSLDKMKFTDVAHTIALPLAEQGYVPAKDPKQAKFLIMVYWGMTEGPGGVSTSAPYNALQSTQPIIALASKAPPPGPSDSSGARGKDLDPVQRGTLGTQVQAMTQITMMNNLRDHDNQKKAGILGYEDELDKTGGAVYSPTHFLRDRVIDELEDNRYFVVLMAYDFQMLWKEKKAKLVWETRFSIRERGNRFDEQLASMAQFASAYFGKKSDGLQRRDIPRGKVQMDDVKILGQGSGETKPTTP